MNPFPIVWANLRRNSFTSLLFIAVVALAVALGIAISAQERALREGSARAADRFDLIVASPGSPNDVLFSVVYLNPTAVNLVAPATFARLMDEPAAEFAAPIGFGDSIEGAPVVGTTAAFVEHLSGSLAEGRAFAAIDEAVVGALVPHRIGAVLEVSHGGGDADLAADAIENAHGREDGNHDEPGHDHAHDHEDEPHDDHGHDDHEGHADVTIVGRMHPTGTPWDRAIVVPVEYNWVAHDLGTGHAEGDTRIGPPFDAAHLPGVPALVVKPRDVAAAYGLRGAYRTDSSMAFFPAEVLVDLYAVLGDAAAIMSALTFISQGLVVASILAGLVAILDLQRRRFAVLRALGASRPFVFSAVWLHVGALVVTGALAGLTLGWGAAALLSRLLAAQTGVAMQAVVGPREIGLAGLLVGLGLLLATIPALLVYRRPVVDALR